MSGQNKYEPSLDAPRNAVEETRPEEEVQSSPISYDNVMSGDQSVGRREVANFSERTDLSTIQNQNVRQAVTDIDNAKVAAMLLTIQQTGQPDNARIQMQSADGQVYSVTLGEVKKSLVEDLARHSQFRDFTDPSKLRDFIIQSNDAALTLSQSSRDIYAAKSRETDAVVNTRNELAAQLGFPATIREIPDGRGGKTTLTSYEITPRDIENRLARTTDVAQREKLEQLKGTLTSYDDIQRERHALSKVDVVAAQLMMGGFTHREGEQTLNGQPATRQEIMRAYETVNRAGRGNAQLEVTPQYQAVKDQSTDMFSRSQLQRSSDAVMALKAADDLRVAGKVTEAQAKYEEALKKVKEVDMATITTQWQAQMKEFNLVAEKLNALGPNPDPREAQRLTAEWEQRRDIGLQLEQIIQVGKEVKTQYAAFLNEQGKSNEALPLLSSVAAQTPPELLAGDKTFEEQMEKAQSMGSITNGDAEKHRVLYEQALAAKDWSTAERELGILKEASIKASEQSIQGAKDKIAAMTKRQTEIDTELAELQQNSTLSAEAKALRQQQLTNEKGGYDVLRKALEDGLGPAEKAAEEHKHQLRYMEGVIAFSKDDKDTAHKIFKELEAEAPEIAANKEYQLEGLIEETRKKGWWERHWDTIVNVGKFVAIGVAIAAAGLVTGGVGAVALGAALGAAGVFTVGAVGHHVAQANGWKSTDNYHNWRPGQDIVMGAVGGGGGALIGRLFQAGGMALAGEKLATTGANMVAQGGFRSVVAGTGLRATGGLMQGAEWLGAKAVSPLGTPVTGTAYGFGTEGIDYLQTGKFNVNEAMAKSASATLGIYGATRFGGFGNIGGQLAYTGIQTGGDIAQNMYFNNQSLETALNNGLGQAFQHFGEAAVVGSLANINTAARAHSIAGTNSFKFSPAVTEGTRMQMVTGTGANFFRNMGVEGRMLWSTMAGAPADVMAKANIVTAVKTAQAAGSLSDEAAMAIRAANSTDEAISIARSAGLSDDVVAGLTKSFDELAAAAKPVPMWSKLGTPALGTVGVGYLGYAENDAYQKTFVPKDYNDPNPQIRIQINSNLERLLKQVKRPTVVRPSQQQ